MGVLSEDLAFSMSQFVETTGVITGVADGYIAMGEGGLLCGGGEMWEKEQRIKVFQSYAIRKNT